ncbi:hypothetical protein [Jannaschia seohaensis]|uniref:D-galactarate dehydratase n=1 Tax=Jannaschia seohaensis TaxID=475081 RepID=A0A2Y9C378_9RHOB|nr:hypothetical protein [Jannaschia seohaensis]PWJ12521.1 hypothetical protein BCF38_11679 [Jannaschia seohaensis]SSA51002.1 hypothetical protein SAMN05421539_11679 [Jannaschia seohaensis]
MRPLAAILLVPLVLGACAKLPFGAEEEASTPPPQAASAPERTPAPVARPDVATAAPEAFDTVSEAEKEAARVAAQSAPTGGELGRVTVSLGDPADPGLWVKSALVTSEQPGTVRTETGEAIAVTLRPIGDGAGGPQISLPALRALGLPITGLHPVILSTSS